MQKRIVVIGAAGEMNREALKRIVAHEPEVALHLTDIDADAVARVAEELGGAHSWDRLDLFDAAALRSAIKGASLVLNGAGPYMRTAEPVMEACLDEGVTYLDFDDDPESTLAALRIDAKANEAGVSLLIGCGASPGYTNVLAVDVVDQLDSVESIDVFWSSGDEGARPFGTAVLEHCLHMLEGQATSFRNGELTTIDLGHSEVADMGSAVGRIRLYEVAHPEPITLPRRFPGLESARCLGTFDPVPVTGLFKGLAKAVYADELTMEDATRFLQAILADAEADLKPWRYALGGMWEQVLTGEVELDEMLGVLRAAAAGEHVPYLCMVRVEASGTKDGRPCTVARRLGYAPDGWKSMADVTGACTAAFVSLALSASVPAGVLSPEDWVSPAEYFAKLEAHGAAAESVVEPDYLYSLPALAPTMAAVQ